MARRKPIKTILVSSPKGLDLLQPIINSALDGFEGSFQLELDSQSGRSYFFNSAKREKSFAETLNSSEIIIVDLINTNQFSFFDIGIARAIGKSVVFLVDEVFLEELPDFVRQSYMILYHSKEELKKNVQGFFSEYLQNPKRFTPRSIVDNKLSSQIVVDLETLDLRDFENLCFELLSRLGYKQLAWRIKDDFIDAITTLKKQDPDGFEYDEFWLVAFQNNYLKRDLLDMAIHDPEYFLDRFYRNLLDSGILDNSINKFGRTDIPVTLLLIIRGDKNLSRKLFRDFFNRDYNRKGLPVTIRVRWWDEQTISSMVQNNQALARKYFSTDALARSGVRLSYEDLYKQNAEINEQLQRTNQLLISERSKIESLERDAAWKLLSFTAAHRLGNPMDAIDSELSNLKIALSLGKTEMINEIIKSMEVPVERAKSIVSEFRNLSIAQELKPEIVNSEELQEILKYSAKKALDNNVEVKFDFVKVPDVSIDVKKLSDCFGEIVSNSLHFLNGDNKIIKIKLSIADSTNIPSEVDRSDNYILIAFSDNGCGVPIDRKKVIFKPFERSYIHGTGLGLAFCNSIIEEHGGKIIENGKPNEGANFEIFLPTLKKK